jgi:hypothetical protein
MVKLKFEEHNGAKFWKYEGKTNTGITTFGEKRITINGKFWVCLMLDSYKFKKELQFCSVAEKGKFNVDSSNGSKWDKTEVHINNITEEQITEIIESLKELRKVHNPKYKPPVSQQKLDL